MRRRRTKRDKSRGRLGSGSPWLRPGLDWRRTWRRGIAESGGREGEGRGGRRGRLVVAWEESRGAQEVGSGQGPAAGQEPSRLEESLTLEVRRKTCQCWLRQAATGSGRESGFSPASARREQASGEGRGRARAGRAGGQWCADAAEHTAPGEARGREGAETGRRRGGDGVLDEAAASSESTGDSGLGTRDRTAPGPQAQPAATAVSACRRARAD